MGNDQKTFTTIVSLIIFVIIVEVEFFKYKHDRWGMAMQIIVIDVGLLLSRLLIKVMCSKRGGLMGKHVSTTIGAELCSSSSFIYLLVSFHFI